MSSALQNRLVGTIIIVAIAVIFLPDLLDGKKQSKESVFVELPQQPKVKKVNAPNQIDIGKIKEAATRKVEIVAEQAVDESSDEAATGVKEDTSDVQVPDVYTANEATAESTKTEADSQVKSRNADSLEKQTVVERDEDALLASAGWVVQLGSFRHKKNVSELLDLLDKAGYRAFSRPVNTNSGTLTKVFVGPDLQKSKLEDAVPHLKQLTKLQGRVTPFTVQ